MVHCLKLVLIKKNRLQFRSNVEQLGECISHFLFYKCYFDISVEMGLGVRHCG